MQKDFIPNEFKDKKSFIDTIFNIDKFITPNIIKVVYFIFLILLALGFVIMVFGGIKGLVNGNIFAGLFTIIMSPILIFVYWIVVRVSIELTIIAFKNNEYLKKISEK